jgi:Sel1 repeat-containing protein
VVREPDSVRKQVDPKISVLKSVWWCAWLLVVVCLGGATAWGQKKGNATKNLTMEELSAAAEGGDAEAQYELGMRYYGEGGPRHPEKYVEALKWFQMAAAQGNGEAADRIGVMYKFGEGVPRDEAEAARWYRQAADKGIAHAQWQLSDMYARGVGVPRDLGESKKWARLGQKPDRSVLRDRLWFGGAVIAALAFALGLFSLQFHRVTGWQYFCVAVFVHVGGAFLVINSLITYGFWIVVPHCSFNFLAPACTQFADAHTRSVVNWIANYAMINLIFRFMMVVGLAMDVMAGWYLVYLVRLVWRRGKGAPVTPSVVRATS